MKTTKRERPWREQKNPRIAHPVLYCCLCHCAVFYVTATRQRPRPSQNAREDSGYRVVMGTIAKITAIAQNPQTARSSIEAAFQQLSQVDKCMSTYDANSQISRVNRLACRKPVRVSKELFEVLQKSIYFNQLTGGAFDITIGPLVELWQNAAETNSLPSQKMLESARQRVGCQNIVLDHNSMSVRLTLPGMKLDLGAIAKGYAIDKAVQAMRRCGATAGLVDLGGDIRCFGETDRKDNFWYVGVQDPAKAEKDTLSGQSILTLKLKNEAAATSGDYRRFHLIKGKKYSHIINSATGSTGGQPASVTIIAPNATGADALATAVSVMGCQKGLQFIEKLPGVEAVLIPAAGGPEILKTGGATPFIATSP